MMGALIKTLYSKAKDALKFKILVYFYSFIIEH